MVQKNAQLYADGFNYDGSGIEVPYDASHNEDSFSVSMWVDPSSTASYQPLINSFTEPNSGVLVYSSDGASGDEFGYSLGVSGDYMIVGSPSASNGGTASLFKLTSGEWLQESKIEGRKRSSQSGITQT